MAISSLSNSNSKLGGGPKGYPVIFDRLVEIIFFFFQSCEHNTTIQGSGSPPLLVFVQRIPVFRSVARSSRGEGEGERHPKRNRTDCKIYGRTWQPWIGAKRQGAVMSFTCLTRCLISHGTGRWRGKRRESKVPVEQLEKWNWFRFDDRTNLIESVDDWSRESDGICFVSLKKKRIIVSTIFYITLSHVQIE